MPSTNIRTLAASAENELLNQPEQGEVESPESQSIDQDDWEGNEFNFNEIFIEPSQQPLGEIHRETIDIPDFKRFQRKTGKDTHKWIPVLTTADLPDDYFYDNLLSSDHFVQPKIHDKCTKNLNTALTTFDSFLFPLTEDLVIFTSQSLVKHGKKATNFEEIRQFFLAEIAMSVCGPKFTSFKQLVPFCRDVVCKKFGRLAKWPMYSRLQEIRSNLRVYDENSTHKNSHLMSFKVKNIVDAFNDVSKDTISICGARSMDETLTPYHGQNGCHIKIPRKPAGEGVMYHNVSMVSIRYSEKIQLARISTEKKMSKSDICDDLISNKLDGKGVPLCGDRGYTTLELVRFCTTRIIPYIGTIKNNFLGGNYPMFPDDKSNKSNKFVRRMFTFRVQNEPIFLTVLYDHAKSAPVLFISNFHTSELSRNCPNRPRISTIYNTIMCGVDLFDRVAFYHTLSRKTLKWTVRVIENVIGFGLTNARAAYCLQNFICMKNYTIKAFYVDILKQAYETIHIIRSISVTIKQKLPKFKTCNWNECFKTVHTICSNHLCEKLACPSHSCLVCRQCYSNPLLATKFTIRKNVPTSPKPRQCHVCKKYTRIVCSVMECQQFVCQTHRAKLCFACCFQTTSASGNNFSIKMNFNKPFLTQ